MREALVGVDIGTTNIKVVAFDAEGKELSAASRPQDVIRPKSGWAEYDPDAMFTKTAAALRDVIAELVGVRVVGVAVASMAETAIPVDGSGKPVYRAIAWHDERTTEQATWWRHNAGEETVYRVTGLPILPIFGANKMMWLREHEGEAFGRMRTWLNTADWIAFRLSGEMATDVSLASRTMLLDLGKRSWSDEQLERAELDKALLAPLAECGTHLGRVHADAFERTDLPKGTPVVVGGHDHPCGALALGVAQIGDVLDSIGTSESLVSVTDEPVLGAEMAGSGYQQGAHVVPGQTYCNGGLYTAGAALEWIRGVLGVDSDDAFQRLLGQGRRRGVFFLPHLRLASPPVVDAKSLAGFIGLDSNTTDADLVLAVVDGLVFEAQASLEGMEERLGFTTRRLRAIGGGARIDRLLRAKASLSGREVQVAEVDEATTLGAAMLAGAGAGVFGTVQEAAEAMAPGWRSIEPDPDEADQLRAAYEQVYVRLYEALAPIHHAVHGLVHDASEQEA